MFRHAFVSILLSNPNIGVATVAAEAGRAQPSTTLAIYTQVYDRRRDEIRKQIPKCSYRKYTISEIINAIIGNGFTLERFDEHPAWENEKLPGEYTAVAKKM